MHSVYPHEPGYLIGCPECDFNCHCGPGVAAGTETECVYLGHEASDTPECPHANCGYGECSWLQGGTNGGCDTHGNEEGTCQTF